MSERYILRYTVILSTYRTDIIIQLFRFTCTNDIQRTIVVTEDTHTDVGYISAARQPVINIFVKTT